MTVRGVSAGSIRRRPQPVPESFAAGFWTRAAAGHVRVQSCRTCELRQHPPLPVCARCGSDDLGFVDRVGAGQVYSFVVCDRSFNAAFESEGPYVVASIQLDDDPDLRIVSNVVGCDPTEVTIGARVSARYEELAGSEGAVSVPVFELADAQ